MQLAVSKAVSYIYLGAGFVRNAVADLFTLRLARAYAGGALLLNILGWIAAWLIGRPLGDGLAVLHYNVIFGIDLVGDPIRLFLMPLFALIVLIMNYLFMAVLFNRRDRLFAHIWLGSAAAMNGFMLVAMYFIYLVNFS